MSPTATPARQAEKLLSDGIAQDRPGAAVLMQLILATESQEELAAILAEASAPRAGPECDRLAHIAELLRRHPDAWSSVRAAAGAVNHRRGETADAAQAVAEIAAGFDRAAAVSPVASVALQSLGDEALLAEVTDEIVAWLRQLGAVSRDRDILDLGCGIGRVAARLAQHVRHVTGIDISPRMIELARSRCAGMGNVALQVTSGMDLAAFPDDRFDLVLAVDSFPYVVLAGEALAARHFAEIARVLKPRGDAAILNFSYRDSPDLDRADVERLARQYRLDVAIAGERPFRRWDGTVVHLVKEA